MNLSDAKAIVRAVKDILTEAKQMSGSDAPLIAFPVARLRVVNHVRTSGRSLSSFLESVNEVLSHTDVVKELGGIFTVCEYELGTVFLVRADFAFSLDPEFNAESKKHTAQPGAFLRSRALKGLSDK